MHLPRHSALLFLGAGALMFAEPALAAFGGKIKNIRVLERNNTQGYRVVVVVQDDTNNEVSDIDNDHYATVEFSTLDGELLDSLTLNDPQRQRLNFAAASVPLDGLQDDGTLSVSLVLSSLLDEVFEADLSLTPCDSGCSWDEASWGETGKLKARLKTNDDGTGTLEARVFDEDKGWDASQVAGLSALVAAPTGEATPVDFEFQGLKSKLTDPGALLSAVTGGRVQVTTTLYDSADNVVDIRSEQLTVGGDALDEGIASAKVKQRRKGDYKAIAYTVSSGAQPIQGLSTEITSADGESLLTTFDEAPVGTERQFTFDALAFDGDPTGTPMNVSLTFRDAGGGAIAAMDVIVENLEDEDEALDAVRVGPPDSGVDEVGVYFDRVSEDGSSWDVTVAIAGDLVGAVHDVELQFNEPFEGPSPQENPLAMPLTAEWQKWADTFDPGVDLGDQDLTVDQILFTEDGQVVEEIRWTGPVGATFKNGQGTRGAATQSGASTKLL